MFSLHPLLASQLQIYFLNFIGYYSEILDTFSYSQEIHLFPLFGDDITSL
jgi:hypothetical protein